MKTITTAVYSFDELSDAAKAKALDWYRDGYETDLSMTVEDFEDNIAPLFGFDVSRVFYSGFSSQGVGACFEGMWRAQDVSPEKLREWMPQAPELHRIADSLAEIRRTYPQATARVVHRGHYYHEFCTRFDCEASDPDHVSDIVMAKYRQKDDEREEADALARDRWLEDFPEDHIVELARDLMRWLYRQLEKDHEWQLSDEALTDSILAAEYDFTEDGKVFRS